MISLRHNFLFIHIPKTAGNSIQNILKNYSEDKIVCLGPHQDGIERFEVRSESYKIHKHSTLAEYRDQLPGRVFNDLFKFTCVRNPWERVISFYFSPHRGMVQWNRDRFIGFLDEIPPTGAYVSGDGKNDYGPEKFGNIDYYMRFERLSDDFQKVCGRIGIPWTPLPLRNKSNKMHYTAYYDKDLVEIVRNKYQEEITYFGYQFEQND